MHVLAELLNVIEPYRRLLCAIGVASGWYSGGGEGGTSDQEFGGMVEKEGIIEFEFGQ